LLNHIFLIAFIGSLAIGSPCASAQDRPAQMESRHFKFKNDGAGRTGRKGAVDVDFENWKSEDGVLVQRIAEEYKSAAEASARLQSLVTKASSVIERGHRKSWDGKRVIDRVRLVASGSGNHLINVIAWSDQSVVHILRSSSWPQVLDFERQIYSSANRQRDLND